MWLGRYQQKSQARQVVAELLRAAPREAALLAIQRDVLVPLELQMLGRQLSPPATPGRLAALVDGALDEHQMY